MATLAVFIALGGGAYAALQKNSVGSKQIKPNAVQGVDANESSFGQVPSAHRADTAANADSANSANSANTANTAGTANGVAANSVGANGIEDPTRSINLPIDSFQNETDTALIDFTPSDGTAPDFVNISEAFAIEWDDDSDGGGANVADTDFVGTSFTVPPDYASGGSVALRIIKDDHQGVAERLGCETSVSASGFSPEATVTTTTFAPTSYTVSPTGTYVAGASVDLRCRVTSGTGGNNFDDLVRLLGVEWRYTATQ
jgi:hypothetical protein